MDVVQLGTVYGGWFFVNRDYLLGSTIISAGLGEDASFDIEFASRYGAKVIIVDPTPRAISHFDDISRRFGMPASAKYVEGGCQPVESYDCSNISKDNLCLVKKALWNQDTNLKFFAPRNPNHVSHSIVNYQNFYSETTEHIEVEAVSIVSLINDLNLDPSKIELMKLDIEGAEFEVIEQCLNVGFLPRQILVEFDELSNRSKRGIERVNKVHAELVRRGYELIKIDVLNFSYCRG